MPRPTATERTIVRAPATSRSLTQWTTDDVDAAEALVNSGNLRFATQLCWSLLGDARVRAALETRVRGLLRLPLSWDESGDGRSSGRVVRALEGGDWYAAHSEAALFSLAAWGILLGVGLNQRVWTRRGSRDIGKHKPFDVQHLRWDVHARKWTLRTSDQSDLVIAPGDRRWTLYAPACSDHPDGDERPWMWGAWRACARPWLGKYLAWTDWMHHTEVHGSPIRTADLDLPEGVSVPEKARRDELATALSNFGADTAIVPVPGYKVRLVEAVARTWEMFPAAMDAAARECVIAITGQTSSTELQQGQETGATLHGRVRADLIAADGETLSTCLREQSLRDYAEINFGTDEMAPWPRWKTDAPLDIKARGDAMKAFGDGVASLAANAPAGFEVDRRAMYEAAGYPLVASATPAPVAPPSVDDQTA